MSENKDKAEEHFANFVEDFCEKADVIFDILQKRLHKSSYNINGRYTVVTIQRKVYTGGTSKPSPTRKDVDNKFIERVVLEDGD